MTRDEILSIIEQLSEAVSQVVYDVDYELHSANPSDFSEGETIALENIVQESITLNDYLINFFVEVNAND